MRLCPLSNSFMVDIVSAAGGIVVQGIGDTIRMAVAHRPGYDDWSFPKGKADPNESSQETAVREVEEEIGVRSRIVGFLGTHEYELSSGKLKQVDFYLMRPLSVRLPAFQPNREVDEVRWVSASEARDLLDYRNDRTLLDLSAFGRLCRTGTVHLFRHSQAGSRSRWTGDDRLRPLTEKGEKQSKQVAADLASHGVDRILTSPYQRCVQSVDPLAKQTRTPIETMDELAEGGSGTRVFDMMLELAGLRVVMCSHGDVIPDVLRRLNVAGTTLETPNGLLDCKKASVWEVSIDNGRATRAIYRPPPI